MNGSASAETEYSVGKEVVDGELIVTINVTRLGMRIDEIKSVEH